MDPARTLPLTLLACLSLALTVGCQSSEETGRGPSSDRSGGAGGRSGGTGGAQSGAAGGTAGSAAGGSSGSGSGGKSGSGSGGAQGGSGGQAGSTADAAADSPVDQRASDGSTSDAGAEANAAESDHLTGRPDLKICKKEWSAEQCCAFLCACLNNLCTDSPKGKPGIATCMTWCPKLSDMARRCHVYHCYVSVSPTGGIRDHDSHCGHAADQVPGGGCPAEVYQK